MAALNLQRQGKCGSCNGQQDQSSNQNSMTFADLWYSLVDYGVPRSEIGRKPTKFLLDLYEQKY